MLFVAGSLTSPDLSQFPLVQRRGAFLSTRPPFPIRPLRSRSQLLRSAAPPLVEEGPPDSRGVRAVPGDKGKDTEANLPLLVDLPTELRIKLLDEGRTAPRRQRLIRDEIKRQQKMTPGTKGPAWQPRKSMIKIQERLVIEQLVRSQAKDGERQKWRKVKRLAPQKKLLPISMFRVGERIRGRVIQLKQHGAWIDIGCTQKALLHIRDMAEEGEGWISSPTDKLVPGQELNVTVKYAAPSQGVLAVTLRPNDVQRLQSQPAVVPEQAGPAERRRPVDSFRLEERVDGVVTRVTEKGCFVDIGADVDAWMHTMDVEDPYRDRGRNFKATSDFFHVGQHFQGLYIKTVDKVRNRLRVTPWSYREELDRRVWHGFETLEEQHEYAPVPAYQREEILRRQSSEHQQEPIMTRQATLPAAEESHQMSETVSRDEAPQLPSHPTSAPLSAHAPVTSTDPLTLDYQDLLQVAQRKMTGKDEKEKEETVGAAGLQPKAAVAASQADTKSEVPPVTRAGDVNQRLSTSDAGRAPAGRRRTSEALSSIEESRIDELTSRIEGLNEGMSITPEMRRKIMQEEPPELTEEDFNFDRDKALDISQWDDETRAAARAIFSEAPEDWERIVYSKPEMDVPTLDSFVNPALRDPSKVRLLSSEGEVRQYLKGIEREEDATDEEIAYEEDMPLTKDQQEYEDYLTKIFDAEVAQQVAGSNGTTLKDDGFVAPTFKGHQPSSLSSQTMLSPPPSFEDDDVPTAPSAGVINLSAIRAKKRAQQQINREKEMAFEEHEQMREESMTAAADAQQVFSSASDYSLPADWTVADVLDADQRFRGRTFDQDLDDFGYAKLVEELNDEDPEMLKDPAVQTILKSLREYEANPEEWYRNNKEGDEPSAEALLLRDLRRASIASGEVVRVNAPKTGILDAAPTARDYDADEAGFLPLDNAFSSLLANTLGRGDVEEPPPLSEREKLRQLFSSPAFAQRLKRLGLSLQAEDIDIDRLAEFRRKVVEDALVLSRQNPKLRFREDGS
ncbi:unnamed protein product [Vitrella brassicaformis CCMP3155]|uniref:S1 motif domain-containing protein n=2 Tax=Vitrella brassicaformis TaxID=1169539 RepID=A0A0G4EKS7_VITBC|nr:unnamed protein product [Vitrella brassicaformis CCMP3155]|eukprot:CEL97137.1 unnamed protein product [Vitrella brassicaformis CCMP3155]